MNEVDEATERAEHACTEVVRAEAGLQPRRLYKIFKTTPEELERRAAKIKPLYAFDGVLHYLQPQHLTDVAYTWSPEKAEPAPALLTLGEFRCLHTYGFHGLFKPSIAEVLWQFPAEFLERAVAFEIVDKPKNATDLNDESEALHKGFHVSTVRIYGN